MLLAVLFKSIVKTGTLKLIDANGRTHYFGDDEGPNVTLHVHDRALHTRLFLNPMLAVGEAYMEGTLTIEDDSDIYDFLALCMRNMGHSYGHWAQEIIASMRQITRRLAQHNPVGRAQKNVAHHYDLSETLYELFLDKDQQYSCAYFTSTHDSLDDAQENKKRHIAAKLLLEPNCRLLDIGSVGVAWRYISLRFRTRMLPASRCPASNKRSPSDAPTRPEWLIEFASN